MSVILFVILTHFVRCSLAWFVSGHVTVTLKATKQGSGMHAFTFPFLPQHLYSYVFLPALTGVLDQIYFLYFFIQTFQLFNSEPHYPIATHE